MNRRLFLTAFTTCVTRAAAPLQEMPRGFLRKPEGAGKFPAVILIHGGLREMPVEQLRKSAMGVMPGRFAEAGYVVAIVTYRSRDHDPQSPDSLEDCMAALQFMRMLPYVDSRSIVAYGCSGGGDLTLEMACAGDLAAIIAEEPASMMFTGTFNSASAKEGERYTPADSAPITANPKKYYTRAMQKNVDRKLSQMRCPVMIVQGDQSPVNRYNADVLIPALQSWRKVLEVKTYPGRPHCFGFQGRAGSEQLFRDVDTFCRKHLPVKPRVVAR
ncbi:MAG: alpha/beta hydrolase [Acidobacteria bacterium]|nr:alpha/beta hydrolase [Acidobacteriota bacterium]